MSNKAEMSHSAEKLENGDPSALEWFLYFMLEALDAFKMKYSRHGKSVQGTKNEPIPLN